MRSNWPDSCSICQWAVSENLQAWSLNSSRFQESCCSELRWAWSVKLVEGAAEAMVDRWDVRAKKQARADEPRGVRSEGWTKASDCEMHAELALILEFARARGRWSWWRPLGNAKWTQVNTGFVLKINAKRSTSGQQKSNYTHPNRGGFSTIDACKETTRIA